MDDQTNNPASRLLKVLEKVCELNPEALTRQVWAIAFNTTAETHVVYPKITKLLLLIHEIKDEMSRLPIKMKTLSTWPNSLEASLFQMNLDIQWSAHQPRICQVIQPVRDSAELLSHLRPERIIKEETLQKFESEIRSLLDDVTDSDIEKEIKDFIIEQLRNILFGIDDFEIRGIKGIQEAVQQTVGAIASNGKVQSKLSGTSFGKRLWQIISVYAVFAGVINDTPQLVEMAQYALPPAKHELLEENPIKENNGIEIVKPEPIYKKDEDEQLEQPSENKN
jgi:hypothetical protein